MPDGFELEEGELRSCLCQAADGVDEASGTPGCACAVLLGAESAGDLGGGCVVRCADGEFEQGLRADNGPGLVRCWIRLPEWADEGWGPEFSNGLRNATRGPHLYPSGERTSGPPGARRKHEMYEFLQPEGPGPAVALAASTLVVTCLRWVSLGCWMDTRAYAAVRR